MLSVMEVIIALKQIPLFASIHGEGLKRLSDVIREKQVLEGELAFVENDLGEEMYFVHSGSIKIYHDIPGKEETLEVVEAGGYFGELTIVDELPRSASARAQEDSILLVLHMDDFRQAVQDYPDIAFAAFKEFSRRIRRADERIRSLAGQIRRMHSEIES